MSHPHELFNYGAVSEDIRKQQKVPLTLSEGMKSKGKDYIKEQNPALTDLQVGAADVIGAAIYPTTLTIPVPNPSYSAQASSGCCVEMAAIVHMLSPSWYAKTSATSYNSATNIFSPNYVYDQIKSAGCGGGSAIITCLDFMTNNGCVLWDTLPFVPSPCDHIPSGGDITEAALYKIGGYSQVVSTDIAAIKSILSEGKPLIFGVTIDYNMHYGEDYDPNIICDSQAFIVRTNNNYIWKAYSTCIYGPHAMAIIGWDDTKQAFLAINSYGVGWGDAGNRWIDYTFFSQVTRSLYYITSWPTSNTLPIANAGFDQTVPIGGTAVLDGTASSDPDGTITGWLWTQVGASPNVAIIGSGTSPVANATNLIAGTYTFDLAVTDNNSNTAHAQTHVTVPSVVVETLTLTVSKITVKGKTVDRLTWVITLNSPFLVAELISTNSRDTLPTTIFFITTPQGSYDQTVVSKRITRYYKLKITKIDGTIMYSSPLTSVK